MPRNGSGTMSVANSFSPATTISSSAVNANFSDIATEVTNSLPRDGQASMTGQLKASTGSAASPGISFGSDTDSGLYRKSADTIGIAAGGLEVGSIDENGISSDFVGTITGNVVGTVDASDGSAASPSLHFGSDTDTGFYLASDGVVGMSCAGTAVGSFDSTGIKTAAGENYDAFPAGTAMLFVQSTAPTGWTKSTSHNDKALRVVSGGASDGGSTPFTTVFRSRTISQANLPAVNLSTSSISATTTLSSLSLYSRGAANGAANVMTNAAQNAFGADSTAIAASSFNTSISGSVPLGGSGTAMDFAVQYVDVIIAVKD
jgi:hypothetical protein